MIKDEKWPVARLIPISSASGIEAQERRAASALLAVMGAVNEFGRALLKPLGAPSGRIETFIEVPFKLGGKALRPDGIILVSRGGKNWGALVECKTAGNSLEAPQIDAYLDLARELQFDAVLSISNQYVTSSTQYPVDVDRRKTRRVALHHWSWIDVLTESVVQKQHRGVSDPDQAYILGELIRYLSDPRSGAVTFDSMGPAWVKVRDGARENTLRKGDDEVAALAARWDDLMRYMALDLTKDLGRDVRQFLDKSERSPATRQSGLRESLAATGRLYATLQVPDAAAPLSLVADLRSRQILVSTEIDAPKEGRSKGRLSWLLRQLQSAPDSLKIEARLARSQATLAATLGQARQQPDLLYPEQTKEIRSFIVTSTTNMGTNRSTGRGSFIDSVMDATKAFYADVMQNLRPWKASPPKLKKEPEQSAATEESGFSPAVDEALERAEQEQVNASSGSSDDSP